MCMDAKRTIAWNLRHRRVLLGLSQERLALEANIDRSYVGRVERASENVTIVTLEAMANALNIPVTADSDEAAPLFRDDCAPGFRDDLAPLRLGSCWS